MQLYFFNEIDPVINTHSMNLSNLILCGDFNCCLKETDRSPPTHLTDGSRKKFRTLLQLFDIWEVERNNQTCYTYIDKSRETKSRLDYILVTKPFIEGSKCKLIYF